MLSLYIPSVTMIESFSFENGLIQIPTRPGLGIEINELAVKKYKVA